MKKIHRFIINQPLLERGGVFTLVDRALVHQISRVLRLAAGEALIVCDGKGSEAKGIVLVVDSAAVTLTLDVPYAVVAEPKLRVHLYAALIRAELFDFIVQKTTELGIASITPLITERTVRTGCKRQRLETIAKEAAELSGRGKIPFVYEPLPLRKMFDTLDASKQCFFADQQEAQLPPTLTTQNEVIFCVGPEGGWTDKERVLFAEAQGMPITLGPLVLRAETAAIVGCFAMLNAVN